MNRVLFSAEGFALPLWSRSAGVFVRKVLKILDCENWELSVLFCDNRYIKSLNRQYRNKNEPTDVLAFPLGESSGGRYLAGDIVISLSAVEENARFFDVLADQELRRLLVHGILHLSGEDHATNEPEEPMLKRQEEIIARLAGQRIQE